MLTLLLRPLGSLCSNAIHLSKASSPMVVMDFGRVSDNRWEHLSKAQPPMVVMEFVRVSDDRWEHS